jgi:protoheme IX farnesyltransferase
MMLKSQPVLQKALTVLHMQDILALFKPRLSGLVLLTHWVGVLLAHPQQGLFSWFVAWMSALGTLAVVAGANGLNSYLERDIDARMHRTQIRPLPQGRIEPSIALCLSLVLAFVGIWIHYRLANPLTAFLDFIAIALYAFIYTPMKQLSPWAVFVGAIPGAMPPLLGCSSMQGYPNKNAIALFVLMILWQIPHFLAIAIYLCEDYQRGHIRVWPWIYGIPHTIRMIVLTAWMLLPWGITMLTSQPHSYLFFGAWVLGSSLFAAQATQGCFQTQPKIWARRVFKNSLLLLCWALFLLLCVDSMA